MKTLSLDQTLVAVEKSAVQAPPKTHIKFLPSRWILRVGMVVLAVFCMTQLSAANELVDMLFTEIEHLQRLLEDPSRWLH